MDMTILVPSCPKVNQLYIKIKFDTFEQLMLHYDFVAFSFLEFLDWIKPCVEITWKIWRTKEIDWGPSPSLPNVLHQATMSLLVQGKQESKSSTFWILDLDPLKSRFDKLSQKYTTDQNGVRMKSWRPSQIVSVLQSESSLRDASSLLIQSIIPE
jgi:hypothetical protein